MRADDLDAVVDVHMRSFPGFFLTSLGGSFLRELYGAIITDETGIAIVGTGEGGTIVGFVAGTTHPSGFYRRLIARRLWRFAAAAFLPLLRSPRILPRLLRALSLPRKSETSGERAALLMSLAVSPDVQRGGMGRMLNDAFLEEALRRGATRVLLTTDKTGNDTVNSFYQKAGFRVSRTFVTPEGREMYEYEIVLNER
jgi:ribosomal protein S18 acetylase RimI-like enzyme